MYFFWLITQTTGFSVTEAVAAVASPTSDLVDGCGTVSSPCSGHGMCSHVPVACSTALRSCTSACTCDVGYSGPTCAMVNETVGARAWSLLFKSARAHKTHFQLRACPLSGDLTP